MKVRVLDAAENDLIEGYQFYESQRAGLGRYFLEQLYADIAALAELGGVHPIVFQRYFQRLSRRFPYAIYYRLEAQQVLVYAVLDCRMNPRRILRTLTKR